MLRRAPAALALSLLISLPALAKTDVATVTREVPLRAGPGAEYGTWGTAGQGERVNALIESGDAFSRLTSRYYLKRDDVSGGVTLRETRVTDYLGREQGRLPKGAKLQVRWSYGSVACIYAYLPSNALAAPSRRVDALPGRWETAGELSPGGPFKGHVWVSKDGDGFSLRADVQLDDGRKVSWTAKGTVSSNGRKVSLDVNASVPGIAGALTGQTAVKGDGDYDVRLTIRGGWKSKDGNVRLSETWTRWAPADANDGGNGGNGGGTNDGGNDGGGNNGGGLAAAGTITAPKQLLAVPGKPEVARQDVVVQVQGGKATLEVSGAAKLLKDGQVVSSGVELPAGTHRLSLEGTQDGKVELRLVAGSNELANAETEVALERLYLVVFGYEGTEVNYLSGDINKVKSNLLPKIGNAYLALEDGSSYDQKTIDAAINDAAHPRKVVIDWCTTRGDLMGYLARGTVRGLFWGSHGFMEPWPGCPDSELDLLESRVWSAEAGNPVNTESRNFVREWKAALEPSIRTHGKLDFMVMHSCCTGGIGSYADEVWHYTMSETKSRAEAKLGVPLPPADKLRYSSFGSLSGMTSYQKVYVGPSYFGLSDVSFSSVRGSINSNR
ncbi:MAG: hypothetical protein AB7N76_16835 [Planctomycetota bacterium]